MKKKLYYMLWILLSLIVVYFIYSKITDYISKKKHQEWVSNLTSSASDHVHILKDTVLVDYLNEKRTLAIYLPPNYTTDTANYSVIYFLDGQSLFDQKVLKGKEWQVDEVLDSLGALNYEQSIVVGIYNSDNRMTEYMPISATEWYGEQEVSGAKHAEWIVKQLKPWIDAKFRTKKEVQSTIIGGASLGGLMSYYMLMNYPNTFGKAIVLSPSFWVSDKVFEMHEKNTHLFDQKIYFNAGELESITVNNIRKMQATLTQYGMPKTHIKLDVVKEEEHSHLTWRTGFKNAYPWIINEQ